MNILRIEFPIVNRAARINDMCQKLKEDYFEFLTAGPGADNRIITRNPSWLSRMYEFQNS